MSADDFWSLRKAGVVAEDVAEEVAAIEEEQAQEQAELDALSDEELLVKFDLPDPDGLKMGDDFTGFMKKAVPERLRRRALRRLWTSNPTLANLDMLVDYGEDYTDAATVVENLQTAYQVGKGMMAHVKEMARQKEAAANPTAAEAPLGDGDETEVDVIDGDDRNDGDKNDADQPAAAAMALHQDRVAPEAGDILSTEPDLDQPSELSTDLTTEQSPEFVAETAMALAADDFAAAPIRRRMRFQFDAQT